MENFLRYWFSFVPDEESVADDEAALSELENIDDECDKHGIVFVKISNVDEAKEYGLDDLPALVYFENKIPSIYEGNFKIMVLI